MRNVRAVCAGALAAAALCALAGCSKQETPAPSQPAAKGVLDGDSPIIISDTTGRPTGSAGTPVALNMKRVGGTFKDWPHNGSNNADITQIWPAYTTLDNVQVTYNGNTTSYCTGGGQCEVRIWYEDANNPTIKVNFTPQATHITTLSSTQNQFQTWLNWNDATSGGQISDPTNTNIKKIEIQTTGQPTTACNGSTPGCTITVNLK